MGCTPRCSRPCGLRRGYDPRVSVDAGCSPPDIFRRWCVLRRFLSGQGGCCGCKPQMSRCLWPRSKLHCCSSMLGCLVNTCWFVTDTRAALAWLCLRSLCTVGAAGEGAHRPAVAQGSTQDGKKPVSSSTSSSGYGSVYPDLLPVIVEHQNPKDQKLQARPLGRCRPSGLNANKGQPTDIQSRCAGAVRIVCGAVNIVCARRLQV